MLHRSCCHVLLCAGVLCGLPAAWAQHSTSPAPAPWRLEFYTDLNIPTGTPFEDIGKLDREKSAALAGRPAVQLPKSELLHRKMGGGFGGISGLAYDRASRLLYALSDAAVPEYFTLTAAIDGHELRLSPKQAVFLTQAGERIRPWVLDPEGIAQTPWGTLLVSSEGYTGRKPPVDPALVEFDTSGAYLRSLPIPDKYLRKGGDQQTAGVRHNLGFEGLTVSPGGTSVFLANEGALVQDGARCSISSGCEIRILQYRVNSRTAVPAHEFAYEVDAMPLPAELDGATGSMGVADILALNNTEMLVLERGFASINDVGKNLQRVKLYYVNLAGAADVMNLDALAPAKVAPVRKTLLLDLDDVKNQFTPGYHKLDNYEAICFGPDLPDGSKSILLASDNNFQEAQRTSFLVLRLSHN